MAFWIFSPSQGVHLQDVHGPFQPTHVQSHSARVRTQARSNHFQSLTASNFEALWPIDLKFSAFKDLFPFSIVSKVQEAGSILKVVFALSKWPHLHRAYLVTVCNQNFIAVKCTLKCPPNPTHHGIFLLPLVIAWGGHHPLHNEYFHFYSGQMYWQI